MSVIFLLLLLLLLYSSFFLNCSIDYISFKELCRYGDPEVPEAIQKKTYTILAPLLSQNFFNEDILYINGPMIQAFIYALNLHRLPQDIVSKIFEYNFFNIRQSKYFSLNNKDSIPFLYNNHVYSLDDEYGVLKHYISDSPCFHPCKCEIKKIQLTCIELFNYHTKPLAVLQTSQKEVVACLFSTGSICMVNLNTMKEIWFRKFDYGTREFCDNDGFLIAGYNDTICFLKRNISFYYLIFRNIFNLKKIEILPCVDQNDLGEEKFAMMNNQSFDFLRCMNSKHLFYTFREREYVSRGPYSYYYFPSIKNISNNLYYVSYTERLKKENIFYTLSDDKVFSHFTCNDVCLIATDNLHNLYIWDLKKNIEESPQIISSNQGSALIKGIFWLDSRSNTILTNDGTFKIENPFKDLPDVSINLIDRKIENEQKIKAITIIQNYIRRMRGENEFHNKNTFFKKIFKNMIWFLIFVYRKIKKLCFDFLTKTRNVF